MKAWKTIAREVILDQSPWLTVEKHRVKLPDGRQVPDWTWVITPDYINVVVLTKDGQYLCFRQRKYGVPEAMLALVGGYIRPGEAPLVAAQRELREETGFSAEDWVELGHFLVDPNRGFATGYLYLARQAHPAGTVDSDDLEEQEVVMLSREELEEALQRGEFKILAWAAAVALALNYKG